ncbi:MAG: CYTH domain-containing protein, partial [Candidatus Limnocylindrales bacterium]
MTRGPGSGGTSPRPEEVELKLTVLDPDAIHALISGLPSPDLPGVEPLGAARTVSIVDRYFDTASSSLRTAGLAARIRTSSGATEPRLTVKSLVEARPGLAHRRLELEAWLPLAPTAAAAADLSAPGIDSNRWPPSAARDAITEVAGGAPLRVIATIRQR